MDGSSKRRRNGGERGVGGETRAGSFASSEHGVLRSYRVGALPLINHYLERMGLEESLRRRLPPDDPRRTMPSARVALLMIRNVLVAREPLYGIPEWAAEHSPELLDLFHSDLELLNDDRLGGCLAFLCDAFTPNLVLDLAGDVLARFDISLDELHNDSTTVSLHGEYAAAAKPRSRGGRVRPAITWGHSKDHRPDLKQLLFNLTLADDGGVPVYYSVESGNTNDDVTHRRNWDLLSRLAGRTDFLYVADCKLASAENLGHIARRGGRFVTILPRGRHEDTAFRQRVREHANSIPWTACWTRVERPDGWRAEQPPSEDMVDVIQVCDEERFDESGYRVHWFHSSRKAAHDAKARTDRFDRATRDLEELQVKMSKPRTRIHDRAEVEQRVAEILAKREAASLFTVRIECLEQESFRKEGRGRPSANSSYRRHVEQRFRLRWSVNEENWRADQAEDGLFPVLTNDRALTPRQALEAYKRQPKVEKRFSQLKSNYNIAPFNVKRPDRVVGFFAIYFLALLTQSLIERDLRRALAAAGDRATPSDRLLAQTLEIYPESRRTSRPTTRFVLDFLANLRRHEFIPHGARDASGVIYFRDDLTPAQERLLRLLDIDPRGYGV
jgi:transposase